MKLVPFVGPTGLPIKGGGGGGAWKVGGQGEGSDDFIREGRLRVCKGKICIKKFMYALLILCICSVYKHI